VRAQVRDQVRDQVLAQVLAQVRAQVLAQVSDQVLAQVRAQVRDQVRAQVRDFRWWWWGFGQFEAGWLSFYDYCGSLGINVEKLCGQIELAGVAGWSVLFWDWAFISARPLLIDRDERGRLHSTTGPAVLYPDGWAVHAVHGVRVPADIIEQPASITVARIEAEENAEVRRVMIELYGQERFLLDAGAAEVHRDRFGVLYRKELPNDEPLVMVKVRNSTPEPDGSTKDYFLRVNPELRPLLADDEMGEPQEMTALNAVASTFGKTGAEYAPSVET
jgi:hypothetical protein